MQITSIHFENFKAFSDYSLTIDNLNILVGPNNNGKSTILDAFRILQAALKSASKHNPKLITLPNGTITFGYLIPENSIPVSLNNIQTNYSSEPAIVKFIFSEGQNLYLLFAEEHLPILYYDTPRRTPKTLKEFRREFGIKITVFPTLGPFEANEEILNSDYVKTTWGGRRSSRMFRNLWYHLPDKFDDFKNLVEKTWPGMSICLPEKTDHFSNDIYMFCEENMIKREISWVGFGFQIWLQLLTHVVKSAESSMIIVDEPEIYLHPDLQHKILNILKSHQSRVLLATHSIEIINDAEPSDVVLIDKTKSRAKRITDLKGLQDVANILGSGSNIHLTKLARSKKILFVEGDDLKLLKKIASLSGFQNLFTSEEITVIPINGFSQYEKIINANWAFSKVLGQELILSVLLDRDYRCEEQIEKIKLILGDNVKYVNILDRKEIENYLLIPEAIEKAIKDRFDQKQKDEEVDYVFDLNSLLHEASNIHKEHTLGQITAEVYRHNQTNGISLATVITTQTILFDNLWCELTGRFKIGPGKSIISSLNSILQEKYGISITTNAIISKMKKGDVPEDLILFFKRLEEIRLVKT